MSPLLVWALRFTEDFAADILAALAEQQRLRSRIAARHNPDAAARLAALLDEHARTGTPLPGETIKGRRCAACLLPRRARPARASPRPATRCAAPGSRSAAPRRWASRSPGSSAASRGPATISYHQAPALALRLSAACLVVVAYLSGLRPAEILHLQPGCCPAPDDDGTGPVRYRLHGRQFKAVRNDDGTPAPDGAARQWTVIPPVHTAIGILEQLTATSHLFPLRPHWLNGAPRPAPAAASSIPRGHQGQAAPHRPGDHRQGGQQPHRRVHHLGQRLRPRARAGQRDDPGRPGRPGHPQPLPPDHRLAHRPPARRHGSRWRSSTATCAHSPARATAGASRHGLARVLDIETAAAMASYLQHVSDRLNAGERRLRPRRPAAR